MGKVLFSMLISITLVFSPTYTQQLPLHYDVENTGADCPSPPLPSLSELPVIESLPDPFEWSDGSGRITNIEQWRCRRAEIVTEIQHYQLGYKPLPPDTIIANFTPEDSTIWIAIIDNNDTLNLTAYVFHLPNGEGPFPVVILTGGFPTIPLDFFTTRDFVVVSFRWWELAPWQRNSRSEGAFFQFYPDLQYAGSMLAWAWGVSRLIDVLYILPELKADTDKIAVTGCSFAGKIAIYSAVLDERIALTISQEPGCGGSASWRVAEILPGSREKLSNALWAGWYHQNLGQFSSYVTKLPYDHHEVMGAIAPRPLFVLGNPDYEWLAEEATYVACKATKEIYKALGVPERFGFSQVAGHEHCQLPQSQYSEVTAFIDKFLLGIDTVNTEIEKSPYTDMDLTQWITWETPDLTKQSDVKSGYFKNGIKDFKLGQNYPNPFNPLTKIEYVVKEKCHVKLSIYDIKGNLVTSLVDNFHNPGIYTITFDGSKLPSGVYLYKLEAGDFTDIKKMLLVQ